MKDEGGRMKAWSSASGLLFKYDTQENVRRLALMVRKCPKEMRMVGLASLITQHFVKAVGSSSIRLEPFPHLVIDGILPGDIFRSLSDDLPSFSDLAGVSETSALGMAAYDRRASLPVEELSSPSGSSI
ncbi:MAG: hypothetical protein M3430_07985 [Acidobacteriota bacterium]|nr:hypothetical protein [Acidobacteriota bacterium]